MIQINDRLALMMMDFGRYADALRGHEEVGRVADICEPFFDKYSSEDALEFLDLMPQVMRQLGASLVADESRREILLRKTEDLASVLKTRLCHKRTYPVN